MKGAAFSSKHLRDEINAGLNVNVDAVWSHLPFDQCPVGQADAVLPQDVGHGQGDAHVSGHLPQPLVKLLKLLRRRRPEQR